MKIHWRPLALLTLVLGIHAHPGLAQQAGGTAKDKEALAKNAEGFVEAFHQGDAKTLAAFWTPDGDYTDQTGRRREGREAIEKAFQGYFANAKGMKLRIDSDSLRFLTPDVAVEDGTTEVYPADGAPPSRTRYTIVHVKKDGRWLLGSVRDTAFLPPGNYEHLRILEWAVGDWVGEADTGEVEHLSLSWAENQNFLVGSFSTTNKHVSVGNAKIWIGWDPAEKRLRSWSFDASGAFGEGAWTQEGKGWVVKTTTTLQNGTKASSTYLLGSVDPDTLSWEARERVVDGKPLPAGKAIKLKRAK